MQQEQAVAVVQAWHEAANCQDGERLVELSDPNIEIVGPRGSGFGAHLLREWLGRAGLTLETQRVFARDQVVVVAQHGVWRSVETGEVQGEADLASRFRVADGRVVQFARHDRLEQALDAAGLELADELVGR